jgi:hypothetical protein
MRAPSQSRRTTGASGCDPGVPARRIPAVGGHGDRDTGSGSGPRGFTPDVPVTAKAFRQRSAPFTVHTAAEGIAQACIPQPDQMLRDLLIAAIGECAAGSRRHAGPGGRRGTAMAVQS